MTKQQADPTSSTAPPRPPRKPRTTKVIAPVAVPRRTGVDRRVATQKPDPTSSTAPPRPPREPRTAKVKAPVVESPPEPRPVGMVPYLYGRKGMRGVHDAYILEDGVLLRRVGTISPGAIGAMIGVLLLVGWLPGYLVGELVARRSSRRRLAGAEHELVNALADPKSVMIAFTDIDRPVIRLRPLGGRLDMRVRGKKTRLSWSLASTKLDAPAMLRPGLGGTLVVKPVPLGSRIVQGIVAVFLALFLAGMAYGIFSAITGRSEPQPQPQDVTSTPVADRQIDLLCARFAQMGPEPTAAEIATTLREIQPRAAAAAAEDPTLSPVQAAVDLLLPQFELISNGQPATMDVATIKRYGSTIDSGCNAR